MQSLKVHHFRINEVMEKAASQGGGHDDPECYFQISAHTLCLLLIIGSQ